MPPRLKYPNGRPRKIGLAWLALALTGCVLSIDAVVPDREATFDPRLLGTWEEAEGSDRAVIERDGQDSSYVIQYTTEGKTSRYGARLGRLAGRVILDVWPAPEDADFKDRYEGVFVPGHLLVAVDIGHDELRIGALEPDSLKAAIGTGILKLAYLETNNQLVLRDATPTLQAELGPYLGRPGALGKPDVWRRSTTATGPAVRTGPVEPPCFETSAWREADQLFHRDPHWLGSDVASTVDLGGGRILWLFGDTWIDPTGRGTRQGATMVSNSVGIQTGTDPTRSSIAFYWGTGTDGKPAALFPNRGSERLWFGNGVRVGDRLVLFFVRVISISTGLGFESVGWTAVMVENPDAEPSAWRVRPLETPANATGILVGLAGVVRLGDHVHALGSQNPVKSHPIYVARWPAEEVRRGNLQHPEWWAGELAGWVADSSSAARWPLFENGQSEVSIHLDQATGRFLEVQTQGFGAADLMMRAAPGLTGPWSAPRMVYRPPEYYRPNVMIYAGKAHPELTGADLVLTYATNTFKFGELLSDSLIYYPRFVRLTRCRQPGTDEGRR